MSLIDITGKTFGRLYVISEMPIRDNFRQVLWLCQCSCGNEAIVRGRDLRNGSTQSCGCLQRELLSNSNIGVTHGGCYTRLYRIWRAMINRCEWKSHRAFGRYGGRGIRVCNEWRDDFATFQFWAMTHGYVDNLTIDRINNNGNYDPSNCQWLTRSENSLKGSK